MRYLDRDAATDQALADGRHVEAATVRAWALCFGLALVAAGAAVAALAQPGAGAFATAAVAAAGAGAALWLAARVRRLATAAGTLATIVDVDPECGMPGPRALEADLGRALEAGEQRARPLAVLVVELGDLLPLHVERGLAAGRLLTRQVALSLDSLCFPRGGRTYRMHGSALAATLPDTSHAEAEKLAKMLAPSLELFSRRNGGLLRAVAGSAVALPGDLADDLLARAEASCARARAGDRGPGALLRPVTPRA